MADVTFTFQGDASALARALESIRREVAQTRVGVEGMGKQIVTTFAAIGGAIATIKGAFSALGGISSSAAEMEQTGLAIKVMMGDAAKAAAYVNKLREYAAATPFEFPDIAAAAKTLLAMGTEADKSVEVLKRLGDIASVSGKPLKDLAFLYAKAQNAGLTNEVAESLEMQGVPIRNLLAEMKGISFEEVFKGISKRQFAIEDLDAALVKLTGPGGLLENMTLLQSQTFSGALSTLTDNVGALSIALGTPINAAILPVMQEISAAVEACGPQVDAFGRTLGAVFTGVADVARPLVTGLVELVSALGGLKTVVAAVVAGLLLYAGQNKAAAMSTISLKAEVMKLGAVFKGLNLASFVGMFKGAMVSLRSSLSATLVGMKFAWSTAWVSMVAVAKSAMLAIKAAIVSTGIGLIIVGIGEALGALYSWFMSSSQAAEETAEANKRFQASLKDLDKNVAKVKTEEEYTAHMEALQSQIDELRDLREQAYADEDWDKGEQLTEQLAQLWKRQEHYKKTLPLQIEAAKAAEREAAALREQARQVEELEKKLAQARERMADLVAAQEKKEREDYLSGLGIPQQISLRLSDAGFSSLAALRQEMERMETHEIYNPEDAERYAQLVEVYNKIIDLQKQQAKLNADAAEDAEKKLEDERKRKAAMAESREEFERELAILQAEAAQDEKRLAVLNQEKRLAELTAEYRRQGFEDAEQMALMMVQAEQDAEEARERSNKKKSESGRRMSSTWVQSSQAGVGGGGRSFLLGGEAMLSESKKHTSLLKELRNELAKKSGPLKVDTVIGQ